MDEINKFYFNNINNIYSDSGFFKRYGLDIWLTIIIVIVMLCIIGYFHTLNNLKIVRANWDTEKCNPMYYPYVPLINPDPNKTPEKQITDHIQQCVTEGIKEVTNDHISNMLGKFNVFNDIKHEFSSFSGMFSSLIKWLFNALMEFIMAIVSIIQKVLIGFTRYAQTIKDLFGKLLGILVTNFFILIELMNLGIAFILNYATILMITVTMPLMASFLGEVVIAILMFILSNIPFVGWSFFLPIAMAATAAAASTLVLLIISMVFGVALILLQNKTKEKAFASPTLSHSSK
jgi:hypothetical protein